MKNKREYEDLTGNQIVQLAKILVENDCIFKVSPSVMGESDIKIEFLGEKSEESVFWDDVESITSEF